MIRPSLGRRLAAEAAGTLVLAATVVGTGIMATGLTTDVALQLLANAIATGAILVVLITLLAPISGAHFNPAVSLVMVLRRQLKIREAVAYVFAQIAGGVLGTWLAHAMFGQAIWQVSTTASSGPSLWLAEIVATFGLISVIVLGTAHRAAAVPALVGLYIGAAYWFTASTSFANPAVTIARMLTGSFAGIAPADGLAFIVAQIVGALLATLAAHWLLAEHK